MVEIPRDEIMREMSKLAIEQATEFFARMADEFAANIPPGATGKQALAAFASAIRATNAKRFPTRGQT